VIHASPKRLTFQMVMPMRPEAPMAQDGDAVVDRPTEVNWEISLLTHQAWSQRVAWRVAGASALIAVAEAIAITVLMPLHSIAPYVVSVDRLTGDARVVPAAERVIGTNELNDKHWIAQFVVARQRYVYRLLQHDYDTVQRFADPHVWSTYASLYEGDKALDKTLQEDVEFLPHILSITLNEPGIATVRLQIDQHRTDGQVTQQRYIASLRYQFKLPAHAKESDLIENPFGFYVTAYHLDEELGAAP